MKPRIIVLAALLLCGLTLLFVSTRKSPIGVPQNSQPPAGNLASSNQEAPRGASTQTQALAVQTAVATNALTAAGVSIPASRKRAWDRDFLTNLRSTRQGAPIRFQLLGDQWASGTIQYLQRTNGQVLYVSGILTQPEAGKFFFQSQTRAGKAGDFVGVVEFPASQRAYRLEPTGPGGTTELVERPLDQVICLRLTPAENAAGDTDEIPPLYPDDFPTLPIPDYQQGTVVLQSLAGATGVIYLDFHAGYTPTWGGITYASRNFSNSKIRDIWRRVAEDFIPFNINVTTDLKVFQAAPETSRIRVIFTSTTTASPGAGGVAYYNSWNWSGDTPCWVFNSGTKSAAEAASHEVGHTLNLSHDGKTGGTVYYNGHGSGATGWAPIMGSGYTRNVVQWSKGEYTDANNQQNDLNVITSNNNDVAYRVDDTGATLATSRYLELYPDYTASGEGVIERTGDTDAFQFTTSGGVVSLQAIPCRGNTWANLAIQATLCDSNNAVLASDNPQDVLSASLTTTLAAGTYTFRVTGAGRNDPATDGFSDYASLGYYKISGTVANGRLPSRFSVPENTPNGTLVGVVTANNPYGNPLVYTITGGNTGNAFALNHAGQLMVANSAILNYETLAANTQLTVQFELFVNITNTANPALTEIKRRVVVAITDVNEPPTLTGFSTNLIEHSSPGLAIGQVTGSDPDPLTMLTYSIVGGNSNNMFSIGNQSGVITLAGDLNAAQQSLYNLSVVASDGSLTATSLVAVTVVPNPTPFTPGSINYTVYTNLPGPYITDLTGAASYPLDPAFEKAVDLFEGDTDRDDDYGVLMRGYLFPPVSGNYRFYLATDNNGQLWLKTSGATTNPTGMSLIASISGGDNGWANPREWNKYSSQRSAQIALTAGQAYYIEARMKESYGGDSIAVGWTGPGLSGTNVIPGLYLAPFAQNYPPHIFSLAPYNLHRGALTGFRLATLRAYDVNSSNLTFSIVGGDPSGLFALNPVTGDIRVANEGLLQITTQTNYSLQLCVTDDGSPPLSTTNLFVVNIVSSNAITATTPRQEVWSDLDGTSVSDLTSSSAFPGQPDLLRSVTAFDVVRNVANNYGARLRAYLTPTTSGAYTFYLASDDSGELRFSNTTNPATATTIASVPGYTDYQEWTKYPLQKSATIGLVAGQKYYLEALHKEGTGDDHLEVAWSGPGLSGTNIIGDAFLSPVDINYAPVVSDGAFSVLEAATPGTEVCMVSASDSPLDTLTYKIASGNTGGTFTIDPATGVISVANTALIAGHIGDTFNLVVQVQDSGYGGLYPLKSAQATLTITVEAVSLLVWTGNSPTSDAWSMAANWTPVRAPSVVTEIVFDNTGATNSIGVANNIVDTTTEVRNLMYQALSNPVATNFHTTLINPGITLSTHTDTAPNDDDIVGALPPEVTVAGRVGYWTILGTGGATLTAGNMDNPVAYNDSGGPGTFFDVWCRGPLGNPDHSMTMDMSGLDNFNFGGGVIRVGAHATGASSTSRGILLLARTNRIICATPQIGTIGGIMVGVHTGFSGQTADDGLLQLGVTNFIRLDYLKIGAYRGSTGTVNFQPAVLDSNPTLLLRGIDGVSRVTTVGIGDSIECTADGNSSNSRSATGTLDLTGGTVDALVNNLIVGRNMGSGTASRQGNGTGTLTFTAGTIDVTTLSIGAQGANNAGNATGTVNVRSDATMLVNNLTLGGDAGSGSGTGSGTLKIDGGNVIVTNSVSEANSGGANGSSLIVLTNGGTLTIGSTVAVDDLKFGGGTLRYRSGNTSDVSGTARMTFLTGGAAIDTGLNNVTFGSAIGNAGAGSLTKLGTGRLSLNAANTYTGGTSVGLGTLRVGNASGSATGPGPVTVAAGAGLEGTGRILGPVTVNGTLAPGTGIGTLSLSNSLALSGISSSVFEVNLDTLACDKVIGLTSLVCGGTLTVVNLGGASAATNGATLKLFSAAASAGTFAQLVLPALPSDLAWDTSDLATSGTLRIVSRPNLTFQVTGNALELSWPADQIGWRLECQTNSLGVGISTNWFTVPNSTSTNLLLLPIEPAEGSVFFRLAYP
ncbi:MAG TPA: cadherin domain-containing protein [Verrucomicrobiota bacterium]|nr:cadherin domain-containing protein [Verrucomicrobiota bacterium]